MPDNRITLTGWKAVAFLAILFAWGGAQLWYHIRPVDDAGRQAVQAWLLRGYRGETAHDLLRKLADAQAGLAPAPEPPPMDVEIVSASGRGGTSHMIVKVEVTVNGGTPPDGQSIRYLYVSRNFDDTWNILSESNSCPLVPPVDITVAVPKLADANDPEVSFVKCEGLQPSEFFSAAF
jgi:hypothetical protein